MDLQELAIQRIEEARSQKLRTLDLTNLGLTRIPNKVFELSHLTELKMGHWSAYTKKDRNQISHIPAEIGLLQNLQLLDLSSNALDALPAAIGQLKRLELLDVSKNELESLPNEIGDLKRLQRLDLSNNLLNKLPEGFCRLSNLQRLGLSNNQLTKLPDNFSELQNLQRLDLKGNRLAKIGDELCTLPALQRLGLGDNLLKEIPESFSQLGSLQRLYLGGNQLKNLSNSFSELKELQRLYLSNNQLTTLPDTFSDLEKLQLLDLRSNQIVGLPNGIGNLSELEYLDLGKNEMRVLLPEVAKLQKLELLDLSGNRLRDIVPEIANIQSLQYLYLKDNPIDSPPLEIANRGIISIRNYFKALAKAEEKDFLYEMKLLLVGEGRVGKTSLSKSLTLSDYELEDEQSTEGIDVKPWIIPKEELDLQKDFRLNIWDFGGQEIYHATHQFFLTKRAIYLLVTEPRKEDKHEDFYYWLNIISLLGGDSPILMVMNKCDQPTRELPIKEYQKHFQNILSLEKISCTPDYRHTLDALKNKIKELLKNRQLLPHIGTPLPKVWVDIRKKLEVLKEDGKNYISYEKYLEMCKKYHLNETSALFISEFFHDLGVILHFKDDEELKNRIFLNHDWVTKGVYNVLDNQRIKDNHGHFTDNDLSHIWRDEEYWDNKQELLSLMKNHKFELCFELRSGHYLAPQLLGVDEIPYEWRTNLDNFHFEYRYPFMPKGMLTRLIVKLHPFIHEATNWRYGVLLEYKDTRALVRERYFDRKIHITLEGSFKKEMLRMIRQTIEEIHADVNNLSVSEWISCNCSECADDKEPHFFQFSELQMYHEQRERHIKCSNNYIKNVDVEALIHQVVKTERKNKLSKYIEGQIADLYSEIEPVTTKIDDLENDSILNSSDNIEETNVVKTNHIKDWQWVLFIVIIGVLLGILAWQIYSTFS
ncbi:MAG: COR domain-containing protein [Chitinophagales bacterium]